MGKTHRLPRTQGLGKYEVETRERAQLAMNGVMALASVSRSELARCIGVSRPMVSRTLSAGNITVDTMARIFAACGYELYFEAKKIVR